ncbi:class I adenylate-forming enzyme family protein [Streptomyces sp. NPDC013978]|uniref:class I adenylate-forming enzyme family protein n=1 Tax=Streptomyces sp. NPDC013978 TaxID=3364869 RepID=UPI0037033182
MRETTDDTPDWWGAGLFARQPADAPWAQGGHRVTYGRLRTEVAGLRRLFLAHGIRPGSTVALRGTPSFSQVWSVFALWSLGAQVMLMGPWMRGRELGRLLDAARPQFHVTFGAVGPAPDVFHDECEILVRRLRGGQPAVTDHCLVQFTSGSTGFAKAIGRDAPSLLVELDAFSRIGGMSQRGSRVLVLGSLAHSFNLIGGLLHNMNVGAMTVFPRSTALPAVLRAGIRSGVDAVLGTTEHFSRLAQGSRPLRMPALRRAIAGGERLDPRVYTAFSERHGVRIGQAYGTTETGIIAADPTGWFGPDAVGMIAPGLRVRLVGGELQVRLERSPYVELTTAPEELFQAEHEGEAGWLRTRDHARFDPDTGALRLTRRIDPLVDRGPLTRGRDRALLADRTLGRILTRSGRVLS